MGAPCTAGPMVRELMADQRVGRLGPWQDRAELRTVSLSNSNHLRRQDAFDDTSKVRRWTEGYRSAAVLCIIICIDLLVILS